MDKIRKITAIVVTGILIIALIHICNYLVVDDTKLYTRIMMHEFYNQDDIDILFVGASHSYRGINPSIVAEGTGKSVFNASSSNQRPDAALALIREALKHYNVEKVFLELSGTVAKETGMYADRTEMTSTYIVSDYMKFSLNKYKFLFGASSQEHYVNSLFPAHRDNDKCMDWQYLKELYEKKSTDIYKNYAYDYVNHEDDWYVGNGYVESNMVVDSSMFYSGEGFSGFHVEAISDDWKETVSEIIEVCQDHGVELVMYVIPITDFELLAYGNYDDYIEYVNDFLSGTGVEFIDFNLITKEYFPFESSNYRDADHLNMYGGAKFSQLFTDYLNGRLPDSAFSDTVKERLDSAEPAYHGIVYHNGEENKDMRLIANHPETFEYEISVVPKDGDERMIQEFSSNHVFSVPKEEEGVITVKYRSITDPDNITVVERDYY